MRNPEDHWESDVVAARLRRLQGGETSVLAFVNSGLVRARCLRSERLWEIRPYQGTAWSWVMVGATECGRWSVVFADGENEPETIREAELTAHGALWDAVEFVRFEV